jgi:hypothetical protein
MRSLNISEVSVNISRGDL